MSETLPWFPYDVDEWEEMTQTLTLEEEGALTRLVRAAWRDTVPCTLYDSPVLFERLLGARHKKFRALIERHFTPDPELPGRLRCQWLTSIYVDQAHRYRKRVERNERHRKRLHEKLEALRRLEETEDETHQETQHKTPPETHRETPPETVGETSHETANEGGETSPPLRAKSLELRGASPLDLKIQGQEALAPDRALGVATPRAAGATLDPQAEATRLLEQAYFGRLRRKVEQFAKAHPARYEEIQERVREEQGYPRGRPLQGWVLQTFNDSVMLAVRDLHPEWPTSAEDWQRSLGEQQAESLEATA